ncbi:hypothetical protein [Brevundimonas diminuta]|uniref:hypothetical protein n=1 Tax=Brevundimonas diminuta TaxID=293 RepID=UPI003207D42D
MIFHDTYIDSPPHPLGLVFHPEWQAVLDRRAERECNLIQRQAAAERAEARRATAAARRLDWSVAVTALQALVCGGFVACFWWVLL